MQLVSIEKRAITIELTPEDCRRLADICTDFAYGNDDRAGLIAFAGVYSSVFEASGLAGLCESYVRRNPLTLEAHRKGLVGDSLMDGSIVNTNTIAAD